MGEGKRWKDRFLQEHPTCCFCGGATPATTVDHQPGRVFFRERKWPEGFAFPACESCNQISRLSERILAVLVHGHAGADDDKERAAYKANLDSVRREFPDEIRNLIPTPREIRKVFKEKKLIRPPGLPFAEMPIVKFGGTFWNKHLLTVARKLLLAFHYMRFRRPIPPSGGLWAYIHTNVNFTAGEFPQELIDVTGNVALPVRSNRYLHDQFAIRWTFALDSPSAMFIAQLQKMLVISGVTTEEPERFGNKEHLLRPFDPPRLHE